MSKADLLTREQVWIDELNATFRLVGYNSCAVAGSPLGLIRSAETRALLSAVLTGRRLPPETCARMSASRIGTTRSPETRAKLSAIRSNPSVETRARISHSAKNRPPLSSEARANLSRSARNRPPEVLEKARKSLQAKLTQKRIERLKLAALEPPRQKTIRVTSPETRAKLSAAISGIVRSSETCARISAGKTGQLHTAASKQKMSASQKARQVREKAARSRLQSMDQPALLLAGAPRRPPRARA